MLEEEIHDFHGELGADDIVEADLSGCDSSGGKLSFDLSKPYFGIATGRTGGRRVGRSIGGRINHLEVQY